ncbi:hypothetical protein B4U79_18043 [Dinothrombium tinctorium]|uniref:Uncharacterized protein n=1 Tax=Dinothrombium tinctorium TaxID=1965070 RepID=A0A3S3PKF6_9ACAR|nr:hypothetical protein B4U79_18043 [Dinothrombium tinctorium]
MVEKHGESEHWPKFICALFDRLINVTSFKWFVKNNDYQLSQVIEKLIAYKNEITEIDVMFERKTSVQILDKISRRYPNLKHIGLFYAERCSEVALNKFISQLQNLSSFTMAFNEHFAGECLKCFGPYIEKIKLIRCPNVRETNLNILLKKSAKSLNCLTIGGYESEEKNRDVMYLKEIGLPNPYAINITFDSLNEKMAQMQTLILTNMKPITDLQISNLMSKCPNLIDFQLDDCSSISDMSMSVIYKHWPKLNHLALQYSKLITNSSLIAIAGLRALKSLKLWKFSSITDLGILHLLYRCRYLNKAEICYRQKLSDPCYINDAVLQEYSKNSLLHRVLNYERFDDKFTDMIEILLILR